MVNKTELKISNIQAHLIERVKYYTQVVNDTFPSLVFPTPSVQFFTKGTNAGKAQYSTHRVSFNIILAENNREDFDNTVIHELAHLVTKMKFPAAKQHHGPEFKFVFIRLGGNGKRGHTYDCSHVPKRKKTVHIYKCTCQIHQISSIRHNKILRKMASYRCANCDTRLIAA